MSVSGQLPTYPSPNSYHQLAKSVFSLSIKLTIVIILWLQAAKESLMDLDILVFWMQ